MITKTRTALFAGVALLATSGAIAQDSPTMTESEISVILAAKTRLVETLGYHPKLVRAAIAQNAAGLTQALIDERDAQWRSDAINLFKSSLVNNPVSGVLRDLVESSEFFTEAFLTDAQGANVATFPATSDYWQGDEEKWSASFNGGAGRVFLGPLELDESTGLQQVQISAPVYDVEHERVVGVLVVGVAVDAMASVQ